MDEKTNEKIITIKYENLRDENSCLNERIRVCNHCNNNIPRENHEETGDVIHTKIS